MAERGEGDVTAACIHYRPLIYSYPIKLALQIDSKTIHVNFDTTGDRRKRDRASKWRTHVKARVRVKVCRSEAH